ncbi:hypothetical protein ABMA28_010015 [Loxostege sticticalis]|uniref:FP protein C-terminal domain-containing protein n=1 Tax=Loxostege sticticalis TaxID=481309 RepID=A0ABD0S9E7_LOXSC
MSRSPVKTSSHPNLSSLEDNTDTQSQNINSRKRKQPDEDVVTTFMFETVMLRMQNSLDEINKNINEVIKVQLNNLSSASADMKTEISSLRQENSELKRSVAAMYAQQQETVSLVADLRTSLDFTSNRVDILSQRVDENDECRKHNEELLNDLKATKEALKNIESDLNRQQQRERLLNLEITGIPEAKNESLHTIFLKIASTSDVVLTANDIEHINRVQPKKPIQGRPRSVVVKLKDRVIKDNIIAGIRKRRGITTNDLNRAGDPKPIYVNEHLTPQNKALYKMCREKAKQKSIKYVWIRHCSIFMRKDDTSPAVLINSEEELLRKFR